MTRLGREWTGQAAAGNGSRFALDTIPGRALGGDLGDELPFDGWEPLPDARPVQIVHLPEDIA